MTRRDLVHRLLVALASLLLVVGCESLLGGEQSEGESGGSSGSSGEDDEANHLEGAQAAGIHAFGSVIRGANGETGARLDVVTVIDGQIRYVSGIASPTVWVGDEEIPLLTTTSVGVFETDSRRAPSLAYAAGTRYTFSFEVIYSQGTSDTFAADVTAPSLGHVVEIAPDPVLWAGEPLELNLTGMADGGTVRVVDPAGTVVWDTTVVEDGSVASVLDALRSIRGPLVGIPGEVLAMPGNYAVDVVNLSLADADDLGEPFGALSWFAVGDTARLLVELQ